jgi:hypothetical protein
MTTIPYHLILAAVPPEMLGMPSWVLNGLSIGSLVTFVLVGLATSRLWTKGQVDRVFKEHDREVANLRASHDREMQNLRDRYDTHIRRTVELWEGRTNDAITREREWRDVALKWQAVAEMMAQGIEPLQDQGETMLRILAAWQSESRRKELES